MANTNAGLAVGLLIFVFALGPTIFLLNNFTESIGDYITQLVPMSFRTGAFGGGDWLAGWTIFYWAWWMSWAPFVGVFMARISRGHTIRQFVICVLIVPTLVSTIWFVVMGGTGIRFQLDGTADMAGSLASGVENTLFTMLDAMPISTITVILVGVPFLMVMLGVCYSLLKQLRAEPVVSTVPPGVRTIVAEIRPLDHASDNGVPGAARDRATTVGPPIP
jgi:glycine betaine transporter